MKRLINTYFSRLKNTIDKLDRNELEQFINTLIIARDKGSHIYIMGNGGSGASASHFCCDFNKGMSYGQEKRFKFTCLNDNVATILAYANDISYDDVFVEQLKNFATSNDVVIGISGSGNSENIIRAIDYANSIGATTLGLSGFDGGRLKKMTKYSVHVNINDMQITEDIHMMLCHMLCSITINKEVNMKKVLIHE